MGGFISKKVFIYVWPFVLIVAAFFVISQSTLANDTLFSHLTADQRECIKKALTPDVYERLTDWPQVTNEMKVKMGEANCFGEPVSQPTPTTYGTPPTGAAVSSPNPFNSISDKDKQCLIETLGEVRVKELEGGAAFSETDKTAIGNSGCFGKQTTVGSERITPIKTNPFEGMHESMAKCLEEALGATRFGELKSGAAFTDADKEAVGKAGCFKENGKYQDDKKPAGINPEVEECIRGIIGEGRMNELRGSGTSPTPGEMDKMQDCFKKDKHYQPNPVNVHEGVSSEVDRCMRLALGDRFEDIKRGLVPLTEEDRKAGYKCMGKGHDPIAPAPETKMPENLKQCLKEAVGEARFNAITSGQEPTDEEKIKGEACFKNHETKAKPKTVKSDQILPPPPEEVPFIKEDSNTVRVNNVTIKDGFINIDGQTVQGADKVVVDVYVYSEDPIKATTTANKNGNWTLNYDGTLPEGDHHVYAVVKKGTDNVRSDAKIFNPAVVQAQEVVAPSAESTTKMTDSVVAKKQKNQFLGYRIYIAGGLIGLGILGLIVYIVEKARQKKTSVPMQTENNPATET